MSVTRTIVKAAPAKRKYVSSSSSGDDDEPKRAKHDADDEAHVNGADVLALPYDTTKAFKLAHGRMKLAHSRLMKQRTVYSKATKDMRMHYVCYGIRYRDDMVGPQEGALENRILETVKQLHKVRYAPQKSKSTEPVVSHPGWMAVREGRCEICRAHMRQKWSDASPLHMKLDANGWGISQVYATWQHDDDGEGYYDQVNIGPVNSFKVNRDREVVFAENACTACAALFCAYVELWAEQVKCAVNHPWFTREHVSKILTGRQHPFYPTRPPQQQDAKQDSSSDDDDSN